MLVIVVRRTSGEKQGEECDPQSQSTYNRYLLLKYKIHSKKPAEFLNKPNFILHDQIFLLVLTKLAIACIVSGWCWWPRRNCIGRGAKRKRDNRKSRCGRKNYLFNAIEASARTTPAGHNDHINNSRRVVALTTRRLISKFFDGKFQRLLQISASRSRAQPSSPSENIRDIWIWQHHAHRCIQIRK